MEIFGVLAVIFFGIKIIHDIVVGFKNPSENGKDNGFYLEDTMNSIDDK